MARLVSQRSGLQLFLLHEDMIQLLAMIISYIVLSYDFFWAAVLHCHSSYSSSYKSYQCPFPLVASNSNKNSSLSISQLGKSVYKDGGTCKIDFWVNFPFHWGCFWTFTFTFVVSLGSQIFFSVCGDQERKTWALTRLGSRRPWSWWSRLSGLTRVRRRTWTWPWSWWSDHSSLRGLSTELASGKVRIHTR